MRILKVIALLLHYPDEPVAQHAGELAALVRQEPRISAATRRALLNVVELHCTRDLLDLQADYVALFDRSRALSLHLFEHVHGESRDRGQAMVSLQDVYREHGFHIDTKELPDYVPLFLEFCSLLPEAEARGWLREVEHLLQVLHARLEQRDHPYAVLFGALIELGGLEHADEPTRHGIRTEQRDDTPEALDRVWAEAPVVFGLDNGCGGARTHQGQAVPIDTSALQRAAGRNPA